MKLSALIERMALVLVSLLICGLFLEFFAIEYVSKTSDAVHNTSINNVIRYVPGSKATLYEPDGSSHTVEINANGWNSTKTEYKKEKQPGTLRIAVIGDSYVQASAVNVPEAFAEIIEQDLNKSGIKSEVYRFGIDGAPLTQYLHMLRKEAMQYKPDIVVVQLIHNDFDETYRFLYGRYSSSFLKLNIEGSKISEIDPAPYNPGLVDWLRKSRTFRFLYYHTGLSRTVRNTINLTRDDEKPANEAKPPKHGFVQSAIDVRNINELEKIRIATRYVMSEMKKLSEANGFKLVFSMDAVREAIYSGNPASEYEAAALNKIADKEAKKLELSFLDLTGPFTAAYKSNNKKFEFPWDWHWNKNGNHVAGSAIAEFIKDYTTSRGASGLRGDKKTGLLVK